MNKKMLAVLLLGFSSGIPLGLTGATLQAWMTSVHVDLTVIGIFSLVGLPYTLKFLWSPFMDRFVPPFLGRRRGWMMVTQLLLALTIALLGMSDPVTSAGWVAALAFTVAFFSASQDIVVDAYRTEVLPAEDLGMGAGNHIMGYRLAMIVSGALALIMADHFSWQIVYFAMAAMMLVGVITTFFAPEPVLKEKPPHNFKEAVLDPFAEFFSRKGALEILAFIVIYKLDVVVTSAMMTPFFLQIGFTKTDIGAVFKGFGMVSTIVGALVSGKLMKKMSMKSALWFFGIFQGVSGLSFILLARAGQSYPLMVTAITAENFCSGMGTAAYSAFLMSLCNQKFTATQFALLSSLMAVTRVVAGVPTGWMAKNMGWEMYFVTATLLMIPGLLLLTRYDRWQQKI